ncbi:peptide/nickel transport system ATP-binding protein [Promicromonospora sp. AC04]|uniref:dipeptide ABC transporter ATP-binding protein n=1 Tax=Promicromonospora sp. AC04 TaxID=2135723 RepID=UPI000D3BDC89|nr:ABC transporter ATP-binding protein [Promicromonospora sp. AC04]PUB29774.1 peptide/nickel transport system ATP-binding protein [Promicromonospora sp. AC04]
MSALPASGPGQEAPADDVVLRIRDLNVTFTTGSGEVPAVRGIDLEVRRGRVVALVGESGSGKSVTSLSVLGLLPSTARVTGSVELDDGGRLRGVVATPEDQLVDLRGRVASMVFQEPMTALNPTMTLGDQIAEAVLNHERIPRVVARERAVELLRSVGIPDPERRARQYPHELSGGQRQRVVVAIALACEPRLIVADEPTTALDVTVQAEILDLLRELVAERGTALLLVTHNMGVVADIADEVAVMSGGRIVEHGLVEQVLLDPAHEYTRALLDAVPAAPPASAGVAGAVSDGGALSASDRVAVADPADDREIVLDLRGVSLDYRVQGRHVRAVDGLDLTVRAGEMLGLVGESGSGKSTAGRACLGLLTPSAGEVLLLGTSIARARGRARRRLLADVGVVFQDPGGSLDPRKLVGESIAEPLAIHGRDGRRLSGAERQARVRELLDAVRLPAGAERRYPHEFSGGQRQRIGLARALALRPRLLVADEPTSALDVSVQAEVLQVLRDLHEELGFGCLFISHDLGVVHELTDRVAVLRSGRLVESGPTAEVFSAPRELYTAELLASVPTPDPAAQRERREARLRLVSVGAEAPGAAR